MSATTGEALDMASRVDLRPPAKVMRLERLGSAHQTRLSFLRALLRRMEKDRWRVTRPLFEIDERGVGTALYAVDVGERRYTLVAFGHDLAPDKRTDRVIAEEWDATFALFDGMPDDAALARLRANVPLQEAGRCRASELVLARANRSVRLFGTVVEALAQGLQPDRAEVEATGYLMRTTAVYGNGKFGIADRSVIAGRPEMSGPFRAEMLTVYLIRAFTLDLVEHMARLRGGERAVGLDPALRRRFGIGNATGLGMAPFLVRHAALLDRWMSARETALARVLGVGRAEPPSVRVFRAALAASRRMVAAWTTDDAIQTARIAALAGDLGRLDAVADDDLFSRPFPWRTLYRFAEDHLSIEGQEYAVTLLIEPHGDLVDDLAEAMAVDEVASFRIDGQMSCGDLARLLRESYGWALALDFSEPAALARFWYVSEEKLEPRLGERFEEEGAEKEQPLAVARDIAALAAALAAEPPDTPLAVFLLAHGEHRHTVRRAQIARRHPYAEIQDNLAGAAMRPIDLLRCKLAMFGATRFDPRSDRWLRITLFQGAPFPHELTQGGFDRWIYGA